MHSGQRETSRPGIDSSLDDYQPANRAARSRCRDGVPRNAQSNMIRLIRFRQLQLSRATQEIFVAIAEYLWASAWMPGAISTLCGL